MLKVGSSPQSKFKNLKSAKRLRERESKRKEALEEAHEAKMSGETTEVQIQRLSQAHEQMRAMVQHEMEGLRAAITTQITTQVAGQLVEKIAATIRDELARQKES